LNIPYKYVSRRKKAEWLSYVDVTDEVIQSHHLIINTTPLGMFPDPNRSASIPYAALTSDHYLYDLIYDPAETQFLVQGIQQGAKTQNGLQMLHLQAEKNWDMWTSPLRF
jgi:shikimate dehydrogenase